MMDAKELLEYIWDHPLEPFHCGCAKRVLNKYLMLLRIPGGYHEHNYYDSWDQKDEERQQWAADETQPHHMAQNDVSLDESQLNPKRNLDKQSATTILVKPSSKIPALTLSKVADNNHHSFHGNPVFVVEEAKKEIVPSHTLKDETTRKRSVSKPDKNYSILNKCGIVNKETTCKIVHCLGYGDMLKERDDVKTDISEKAPKTSCLRALCSDRTWCVFVLLLLWANVFRCIMYFLKAETINANLQIMTPVSWFFVVASLNTCLFVSCYKESHFYEFFSKWSTLFKDPTTRALGMRGALSQRYVKVIIAVQWGVAFFNTAAVIFVCFMEDDFSAGLNKIFYFTGQRTVASLAVTCVVMFFCSCGWVAAPSFILIICFLLLRHFREFDKVMKLHIAGSDQGIPRHLQHLRERHLVMCETVEIMDRSFSVMMAFVYGVSISLCCLLLYTLINIQMDLSVVFITAFWLVGTASILAVTTYYMAEVNVAVSNACCET
ncbi:uncharacterized protein LOC101849151 isoform X2 [Aplysia californica]|uniref:Uncharacterized protein LOC101849151 isoform X2 n=1 Tax=Aplysia californica TaxID=6500 RepID=A0ABM1VZ16_APLCA|nr:uncharacterized protein LOC101849151 isoform X2 [Aplysia californica]